MNPNNVPFNTPHALFSRRRFLTTASGSVAAASLGGVGLLTLSRTSASAGSVQLRPITDFLATQGTFCFPDGLGGCLLFVPPAPNFLGWNTEIVDQHALFAGVDYAGLANTFFGNLFGTTMDGTVIERPLADGRAEVRVLLFTENANTWVIDLDFAGDVIAQIASKPTLFGHRPQEGGGYALGQSSLEIRFINSAPGAALPDLIQLLNFPETGQLLELLAFNTQASGPLTAEFGVAEGTPGRCTIRQTGLLATALQASPNSRVALDAFPAELIVLQPIGR